MSKSYHMTPEAFREQGKQMIDWIVLRMCIGQTHTQSEHVLRAWETIQKTARELINNGF